MRIAIMLSLLLIAGCRTPAPAVRVTVPEGYLIPCELPEMYDTNVGASDAFVQAYNCARLGNDDKARIREWQEGK
jgi:hypothetical protein